MRYILYESVNTLTRLLCCGTAGLSSCTAPQSTALILASRVRQSCSLQPTAACYRTIDCSDSVTRQHSDLNIMCVSHKMERVFLLKLLSGCPLDGPQSVVSLSAGFGQSVSRQCGRLQSQSAAGRRSLVWACVSRHEMTTNDASQARTNLISHCASVGVLNNRVWAQTGTRMNLGEENELRNLAQRFSTSFAALLWGFLSETEEGGFGVKKRKSERERYEWLLE